MHTTLVEIGIPIHLLFHLLRALILDTLEYMSCTLVCMYVAT